VALDRSLKYVDVPLWVVPCSVTLHLVLMWAWGTITPQVVQHIMHLFRADVQSAKDDRLSMGAVDFLAGIGTDGLHPDNMNAELFNNLGKHGSLPSPHKFSVPLKHTVLDPLGTTDKDMDMILPHELFAALYNDYPDAIHKFLCPGPDIVANFWDSVQGDVGCVCVYMCVLSLLPSKHQ